MLGLAGAFNLAMADYAHFVLLRTARQLKPSITETSIPLKGCVEIAGRIRADICLMGAIQRRRKRGHLDPHHTLSQPNSFEENSRLNCDGRITRLRGN